FGGDYYKSSWFYYSLFSDFVKNQFAKALDGSTQNFVSLNMLRSFKLQVPKDKKVIKKICDILSSVDNLIEKTETLIAKYQSIKQGMMHDLFTRGVDANGQLRPPVDEAPELYKESELGWIPKGWDITLLEKCTSFLITYGIVQAGPHIERGIPYIRTGDMAGDHLLRETMLCTSNSIANSYKRSEVRTGEIVCAIRATVGKVLLIPPELNGANLTQGTARISPKDNINNIFLLWLLRSHLIQKEFQLSIKGTTFSEITLENLRKIRLCLPKNEKEQDFIANSLNSNERMIEREKRYLSKLLNIKTALMQDLLTGKVRVKPDKPEDTKS
ncbi:restriction modification system DNA specificity domain-containing protein, partial [Candidatus Magnetomorum sp. HK-1]